MYQENGIEAWAKTFSTAGTAGEVDDVLKLLRSHQAAWTVPEMTVEAVQVLMALQKRLTADEQLNLEQLRRLAAIASESLVSSLLTGAGATAHASGTLLALAIRAAPMCDSHRMDHFQIFLEVLQHRSPELAKAQGAAAQVATVLAQAIAALASSKTACRASGAAATTGARLVAVAFLSPALREKDDAMRPGEGRVGRGERERWHGVKIGRCLKVILKYFICSAKSQETEVFLS
eukprot:g3222.t1